MLIVNRAGFIANDSVIEINGQALSGTIYPSQFQEIGGTTSRVMSSDPGIGRLIPPRASVQVTVLNRLTCQASAPSTLTR